MQYDFFIFSKSFWTELGSWGKMVIIIVSIFLLWIGMVLLINRLLKAIYKKRLLPPHSMAILRAILYWITGIFFFLILLQQLGLPLSNVWTVISALIAMIAVGFVAVWSVLSNILCSFMLFIFHPFRVGDVAEIVDAGGGPLKGEVIHIGLVYTYLSPIHDETEINNLVLLIPNNIFFQKIIRVAYNSEKHFLK